MTVSLGTPAQSFSLIPNVATSDVFVVDTACTTLECMCFPESGYSRKQYDSKKSSTYEKQGDYFDFEDGMASGFYAFDTMQVGGVTVKRQEFGLAEEVDISFGYEPIDGFFGIGLPDPTSTVASPIKNLLSQLDQSIFTIWLDSVKKGGMMTFGGLDTQHCSSQVVYVPLEDRSNWQFNVDGFKIGGYSASTAAPAEIQLEAQEIMAPKGDFDKIMEQIGATCDEYSQCTVKCSAISTLPVLTFNIGGAEFAISASQYTMKNDFGGEDCGLALEGMYGLTSWYLGGPFMRTYCSVFDVENERIGFAKAVSV